MKISVIIPFYNEEKQIPDTLEALLPVLNSLKYDYELILIDDGSSDTTWQKINEASTYSRPGSMENYNGVIRSFGFSRNFGKEAAMSAGLNKSSGDAVIMMDGDLQHPPELIPEMISIWEKGNVEVVEGFKKNRKNDSIAQRINAFLFYKIFAKFSGYDLMDASDFKLMDKKVVNEWRRLGEHDTFFRALSVWLGFRREKIYFEVPPRKKGSGKWPILRLAKLSINAITSFSELPLYLTSISGIAFLIVAFILGIQTFAKWLTGTAATGFSTVILLQLAIGGLILISLGLIGIYIARIFTEVKGRPRYIIANRSENEIIKKSKDSAI